MSEVSAAASSSSSTSNNKNTSASFEDKHCVRLVQSLIERCLILCMDQQECVDALAKHANIPSILTITVWKELEKTNPEFFHSYYNYKVFTKSKF